MWKRGLARRKAYASAEVGDRRDCSHITTVRPHEEIRISCSDLHGSPAGANQPNMRIALFEPEIAGNVGAILRLGACLGATVDLIEPMGFEWDDRRVRRAAMDYIDHVTVVRHAGFGAFRAAIGSRRLVLLSTKSSQSIYDFGFAADDVLLFGKESAGVPRRNGCP